MLTYIFSNGNTVKIGKSLNPIGRLSNLQTASSTPLTLLLILPGDHEKELHRRFAAHRVHREWFTFAPEIRDFITSNQGGESGPFYDWLMYHLEREDPIGDLARDAHEDTCFPRHAFTHLEILSHIRSHPYCCHEAVLTLADAFKEWQLSQHRVQCDVR